MDTSFLKLILAYPKTTIVFGIGVMIFVAGVFGKIVQKKDTDRWRYLAVLCGLLFMIIGPSISFLQSSQGNLPRFLRENLADIFVIGLGLWAFSGAVLIQLQLSRLVTHEKRLIANVEDATRHVLLGMPQIFDRAYQLIKEADRELWIVSFALNFGECHATVPTIAGEYNKLTLTDSYRISTGNRRRYLPKDVEDFLTTLREQVNAIPKVRVLTLSDNAIKNNFIAPLLQRPEYRDVYSTKQKQDELYGTVQAAKAGVIERLEHRDQNRDQNEYSCGIYEVNSMPIQLLIAGIKGQSRSGCLVFLVGTEILQASNTNNSEDDGKETDHPPKSFQEPGFYTELAEVVDVYRSLAQALFVQAKSQSNVAPYEGR